MSPFPPRHCQFCNTVFVPEHEHSLRQYCGVVCRIMASCDGVSDPEGCWIWNGARRPDIRIGVLRVVRRDGSNTSTTPGRAMYLAHHKQDSLTLKADITTSCGDGLCCNPAHLVVRARMNRSPTTPYRNRLNFPQMRIVEEKIRDHATITGASADPAERMVDYKPGWSDARIVELLATECGLKITTPQLSRFRKHHIGQVRRAVAMPKSLAARVEAMEQFLAVAHGYKYEPGEGEKYELGEGE